MLCRTVSLHTKTTALEEVLAVSLSSGEVVKRWSGRERGKNCYGEKSERERVIEFE